MNFLRGQYFVFSPGTLWPSIVPTSKIHVGWGLKTLEATLWDHGDRSNDLEAADLTDVRGELSYLATLGSENISAPYFKQCFFRGGVYYPLDWVKHHASQSQDKFDKFTLMFINERKQNANTYLISNFENLEAAPSNLPP